MGHATTHCLLGEWARIRDRDLPDIGGQGLDSVSLVSLLTMQLTRLGLHDASALARMARDFEGFIYGKESFNFLVACGLCLLSRFFGSSSCLVTLLS
jgi:hypothetical protein